MSHGGLYVTDEALDYKDLYCEQRGDNDWLALTLITSFNPDKVNVIFHNNYERYFTERW